MTLTTNLGSLFLTALPWIVWPPSSENRASNRREVPDSNTSWQCDSICLGVSLQITVWGILSIENTIHFKPDGTNPCYSTEIPILGTSSAMANLLNCFCEFMDVTLPLSWRCRYFAGRDIFPIGSLRKSQVKPRDFLSWETVFIYKVVVSFKIF